MNNRVDQKLIWAGIAIMILSVVWQIAGPYLLSGLNPYSASILNDVPVLAYGLVSMVASVLSAPVGAALLVGGVVIKALRPVTPVTCDEAVPHYPEP